MFVRLILVCPLLAGVLALGCTNTQGSANLPSSSPSANVASDGVPGEGAPYVPSDSPGDSVGNEKPSGDALSQDGTRFVAFRPLEDGPTPATDGNAAEGDKEPTPAGDSDIVVLARAIADLRASIEQLQKQNRQIMAALAISEQGDGPELADPSGPEPAGIEPPEGSLAYTVLDLREAVAHLALEQEAMRKIVEQETAVMKPVAPAVPTQGALIIENNTDSDQQVWINGTAHWVWARTNATVTVPVGEVTTKLFGESAKTWEIKAPDYRERIEFVQP